MTVLNYVEKKVDIYSFPSVHDILQGRPGDEIVMGDLHANTIKLIFFLIRHGVISGMNADEYASIVTICTKIAEDLTKDDFILFTSLLNIPVYNKGVTVTLIGDDLADRIPSCDVLTMLVIKALRDNKVPTKILLSNHTSQMIEACELKAEFDSAMLLQRDCASMYGVDTIIKNGIMTSEEVLALYNNFYKKSLKANSYIIDITPEGKPIVYLLTHAGVDLHTIRRQTEYLLTDTRLPNTSKVTMRELIETLNAIDSTFRAVVEGNLVNQLYDPHIVRMAYDGDGVCDLRAYPFEEVMWNRKYDHLDRCEEQLDFSLRYIHGHDPRDENAANVCNLDNIHGKSWVHNVGDYSIIYKTNHKLSPEFVDKFQFYSGTELATLRSSRLNYCNSLFTDVGCVNSAPASQGASSEGTPIPSPRPIKRKLPNIPSVDFDEVNVTNHLDPRVSADNQIPIQHTRLQRGRKFFHHPNDLESESQEDTSFGP